MPRPKFFKIVDEEIIRNRRMTLPLKVGNTYFRFPNHPTTIVLYISTSLTWMVNVAITIDAIVNHGRPVFTFYGVGWEQFVMHTKLMVGVVILFEIDETGQFMARVFGMSGAEVQYSASGFPNAIHLRAPNGLVWTVDVVISQNAAENRGRPVLNLSGVVWQDFVEQMRLEHGVFVLLEYVQDATFNTTVLDKWELEGSYPSDDPNFNRDGPNSFTLTFTREKLERGRVHVPAPFDNRHFHTYTQLVQLRLANNEQVWTVEAKRAAHRPEMNLSTSWRAFMRDNDIRIGDQCEFEIVASGPPCVLRVSIMRPNMWGLRS
ncbi:hypothetical protein LINPERHAP2_LOCUS32569 [Linum perenne]